MPKQTEKGVNPAEIKKHLEALTGQKIDIPEAQLINLWFPTGVHDFADGVTAWRSIIALFPRRCQDSSLLDASGTSSTDANGKRTFLLSDVICLPQARLLAEPSTVLATPRSTSPFYVTTEHMIVNPNTYNSDVQITVYAWDKGGNAAPNVTFDWRCRVVSLPVIG